MAFSRPGVYVQETLNPAQNTSGPNSNTIAAFVGPNDRGPQSPTLVTSWSEYTTKFGTWNTYANNNLPLAVWMYFANGGNQAYISRVPGAGAGIGSRTLQDRAATPLNTLTLSAKNAGSWSTNSGSYYGISFSITDSVTTGYFDLTIYFGGITDAYQVEKFTDLSMTASNARYAPSVINASSLYVNAADAGSATTGNNRNPSTVAVASGSLTGGTNGSTVSAITSTHLGYFDTIKTSLLMNLPGWTDSASVNAAIAYAEARGDVFVIVDGTSLPVGDVLTASTQLYTNGTYTQSSYAAVYYPQLTIPDPTLGVGAATGATRTIGAGGAVAGLYVSTDASRGVFKAPAGLQSRISNAVSVTVLTNAELDALNSSTVPANAIKYVPGAGIVVMGARTLKSTYVDRYVPTRRTLIYLEKALKDLTEYAVFEPNDGALWRRLTSTVSGFLTQFWSQGGLRGNTPSQAFFVKCDSTTNTQTTIDNGEVHLEIGVALQRPAEFVVIKIGQFDGGTTVTVA
jgi:phage tail sheath protein FI